MSDDQKLKLAAAVNVIIWTTLAITTFTWAWLVVLFTIAVLAGMIVSEA